MKTEDVYKVRDIRKAILDIKCFLYSEDDAYEEDKIDILNEVYDMLCEYEEIGG